MQVVGYMSLEMREVMRWRFKFVFIKYRQRVEFRNFEIIWGWKIEIGI